MVSPALNEERSIGQVLDQLPGWVHETVVVDNGSTDLTASVARDHGATVVSEPQAGYGAACLAGLAYLRDKAASDLPDVVVFIDADAADVPEQMERLVEPIQADEADLVIGSRVLGHAEPGSLTLVQRFGNRLATTLVRWCFGVRFTDLGPFRAIRWHALESLDMDDRDFGWTVQMQARAAARGLRCTERPVDYRRRIGKSKISGTLRGVILAGTKIIYTIGHEKRLTQSSKPARTPAPHPPPPAKAKVKS